MADWKLPRDGGCLCGRVRFRITTPPLLTMACHCKGCQRLTASGFSLSAGVSSDGFEVTQGEPVIGALHGPHRHFFCDYCKSWLFTRPEGMDWFVNVRSTMLDDPGDFSTPFVETASEERLPWIRTTAMHSFDGFPNIDAMTKAVEEFAMRGGSV